MSEACVYKNLVVQIP